jgi:hypothetical protein
MHSRLNRESESYHRLRLTVGRIRGQISRTAKKLGAGTAVAGKHNSDCGINNTGCGKRHDRVGTDDRGSDDLSVLFL